MSEYVVHKCTSCDYEYKITPGGEDWEACPSCDLPYKHRTYDLSLNESIELIQEEVNWCLDNPDPTLNHDQRMSFMNGLKRAQQLLRDSRKAHQGITNATEVGDIST